VHISSIVIIDDDCQILAFMRQILEAAGYGVRQATDGREGLRMIQQSPADLVITDVLMPEQDGLEVTMALHRRLQAVKIIAVSGGNPEFDYLDVAHAFGADRTLRKPFTADELLEAVRQVLR
jgi:DNA-binding response OmpR family regulator